MSLSKYQQELLKKETENCRLKVQLSEMETHLVKEQQQVKIEQEVKIEQLKTKLEQKNTEILKAQLQCECLELQLVS
jgi:hypothetical protein